MTLVEFLTARYNETETIAEDAIRNGEGTLDWADDGDPTDIHIARHDPAAVLADVASKRAILERMLLSMSDPNPDRLVQARVICMPVLELLARPYRDHPDFDPTWETT